MSFRHIPLAACALLALAGLSSQAGAQTTGAASIAAADGVPKRTQEAVKAALTKICASPDTEAAMMDLVRAHDSAKVRAYLIQHGDPHELRKVVVDALGSTQGARILNSSTIYFDIVPKSDNVPEPVGLVYLGHPYGWVDWNTFLNSWEWW